MTKRWPDPLKIHLFRTFQPNEQVCQLDCPTSGSLKLVVSDPRTIQTFQEILIDIVPFAGEFSDPNVLGNFAKWTRSWLGLVKQLEQQPKFNANNANTI